MLFFSKNNSSKNLLKKMEMIINKKNSSKISINLKNIKQNWGLFFKSDR